MGADRHHVIAALWLAKKHPIFYVSNWYTVETYLKCYEGAIYPMNGEENWEKTDVDGPKPPLYGKAARRPKKQRRRTVDEEQQEKEKKAKKMSRVGQVIRCKYCLQKGHNVRSCKFKKAENNASGSGIQSNEAANNARSDEVDSGDCNEANRTEVLVTCTPQIFDKNPNNKSAKRTVSLSLQLFLYYSFIFSHSIQ